MEPPEAGKKQPFVAKGYLATVLVILSLIELHVWLATNGYGGIETIIAKFLFE